MTIGGKGLPGVGLYYVDEQAQDDIDKPKNEERRKSLSIAIGSGGNLIAVSEFGNTVRSFSDLPRYALFVTKPGVDDVHVTLVLDTPDIHALIGILQDIVDEE